jgi:hypothetical protein
MAKKERTVWFGMKVTPAQKAKIKLLARQEGITAKEAVLGLVDHALDTSQDAARTGSFLDGIEPLVGSVDGPPDLSANPERMNGFGQ